MYILIDEKINMSFLSIYQTFIQNGGAHSVLSHTGITDNRETDKMRASVQCNERTKRVSTLGVYPHLAFLYTSAAPRGTAMHGIRDGAAVVAGATSLPATNC